MQIDLRTLLASLSATALLSGAAWGQTAAPAKPAAPAAKADPRANIIKRIEGVKLEDVRISPVTGVYEFSRDSQIAYASSDGRYVIVGDMFDLDSDANISETRRRTIRARILETVPETEMLVYAPKAPKYTITVFTDIDCGYCQRMHSQMAEYNRLGIGVRYLFYPRSGPGSDSWQKAERVWCSPNRNDALTRSKRGEKVTSPNCPTEAIARDYELGRKMALDGTPAIILASGEMLPGYTPPGQLMNYLKTGQM